MKQIRSSQIIQSDAVYIDPGESPPVDLQGWEYGVGPDGTDSPIDDEFDSTDDTVDDAITNTADVETDTTGDTAEDNSLAAPNNFRVTGQTIRFNASGQHVVDVEVTFDAVVGAQSYEIKVAK